MADMTDVADALVTIIAGAVYPNGTSQPSVGNCPVIVYQGWPNPQTLDADMAAGKVHISVWPRPGDKVTMTALGDTQWDEASNNGLTGIAVREVRRQTKQFQITVWASTPALRSAISKPVDLALSILTRLTLADGSQATVAYINQAVHDEQQKVLIYRRDLIYAVDYATIQTDAEFTILHTITNVTGGPAPAAVGDPVSITAP